MKGLVGEAVLHVHGVILIVLSSDERGLLVNIGRRVTTIH
jgi:hypothetical protein